MATTKWFPTEEQSKQMYELGLDESGELDRKALELMLIQAKVVDPQIRSKIIKMASRKSRGNKNFYIWISSDFEPDEDYVYYYMHFYNSNVDVIHLCDGNLFIHVN